MTDSQESGRYTTHHRFLAHVRLLLLDDLQDHDDSAVAAMDLRRNAFHEAGHLWAAHNAGLNVTYCAADGVRRFDLASLEPGPRAFVGAAGVLSAAVLEDLDYNCESDEALDAQTVDWTPVMTVATGYGCGDIAVCNDTACAWARTALLDGNVALGALERVVDGWQEVCRIASLLIAGTPVSSFEIGW